MAATGPRPYVKLASTLALIGMGMFTLERYGLSQFSSPSHPLHVSGVLLSVLVIAPVGLVMAGAVVFVVGKMRRL